MINKLRAWLERVKVCKTCVGRGWYFSTVHTMINGEVHKHKNRRECPDCDGTGLRKPWRWWK
jgi:DnaJ-class molecular chaperone